MDKNILQSKRRLLDFLEIKENYLYGDFNNRYYLKEVPKKDGSTRKIKPPVRKVKDIQRKILSGILVNYKVGDCVYGLSFNRGILDNALKHQKNSQNYLVNLDLKDFFPSVSLKSVKKVYSKMGFSKDCINTLTLLTTVDGSIPQGAPTSPYLSAIVLEKLDSEILKYCKKNSIIYTRYFDDLTFSGKSITDKNIRHIEILVTKEGYSLNPNKKSFFVPEAEKIVSGVVIGTNFVDVTDAYKGKMKKAFSVFQTDNCQTSFEIFLGSIAFYLYINRTRALNYFKQLTGVSFSKRKSLFKP